MIRSNELRDIDLGARTAAASGAGQISFALVLTVSLYFLWGMAHNLNDILIAQFKKAFTLSDLQASLVQSCFYVAYLIMPIPVALFMQRFGYKAAVIMGLVLYGTGALLFWPAAESVQYANFLLALFVIACGLTFLETSGLGIVAALGSPERLEWRINLASAFNPLGSIVGILLGRQFIFSGIELSGAERAAMDGTALASYRAAEAHTVQLPYAIIGCTVLAWAVMVACTRFPAAVQTADRGSPLDGLRALLRSRMFVLGVATQFLYVGTQIGIWSFLIRYAQQNVPGMPEQAAALYLTLSLVVFMAARFIATFMLRFYSSAQLGAAFAAASVVLTGAAVLAPGHLGLLSLVGVSFFMSVMFPAIYSIGLAGNSAHAKPASALMIMSITGGAVLSAAMGAISDHWSIALAYIVPLISFVAIFAYCATAARIGIAGTAGPATH